MNAATSQELKLLAKTHLSKEEFKEAREVLLQVNKADDGDAETWFLLGRIESINQNHLPAIRYYEKSLDLNKLSPAVHFYLALAQIELAQLHKAVTSLEQCLAIRDDYPNAELQISAVYEQLGQWDKAVQFAKSVIQKEPHNIIALNRLARVKTVLGELAEARSHYETILAQTPNAVQAVAGLADLYIKAGYIEKATALLEPFLKNGPMPNALAFLFSDICQFTGRCDVAAELIEDILRRSSQPRVKHRRLIYALAKLYDRLKRFDKAFECISEANKLKQSEIGAPVLANQADYLIRNWSHEFDNRLTISTEKAGSVEPVFIVGMPRSGTSLTEQILASHPEVYGAGELGAINDLRIKYFSGDSINGGYPDCLLHAPDAVINEFRKEYLDLLSSLSGGGHRVVTDKMPENFWNLGLIKSIFPAAKIIHCMRHSLDTCISCFFTDFRDGHAYTCDLSSLGAYYKQYEKIMRHWKYALKVPLFEVRYEDLVDNPEETSRMLVDYCGLEWDEKCLSPHKTRRDVNTASFTQVRHKIYTSSVERWRNYDKYTGPLKRALGM